MSKILIPYGTTEGQTAKIAEVIADVIRGHGDEARGGPQGVRDRIPEGTTA